MSQKRSPQKARAHYLYMHTSLIQNDIASAAGVTRKTIWKWIKTENWAAQKQAAYYSPGQVINQLFEELRVIDDNINNNPGGRRTATKEENEQRARLTALITAHLKNPGVNWRNIAPEYEYKNENIVDLNALSALERKNLEKRMKIAEEDANTQYGRRFSEDELELYYTRLATQLVLADSTRDWEPDDEKDSGGAHESGEHDEAGKQDGRAG